MNAARRSLLVLCHFVCPLLFFTNLTRNPYVTQISLLNAGVVLALAAWAARELTRPDASRLPRAPIALPLAVYAGVWAVSWAAARLGHASFFVPSIKAEGLRTSAFLAVHLATAALAAILADEDGGDDEVPLAGWTVFVLAWGAAWTLYPSLRARVPGRPEDLFAQVWDLYGAFLWAAGFGAASWLCRRGRLADFLHLAFASAFLGSAYGVLQYFNKEFVWPQVLNPYGGRAVSTFGNPNFLSTFVAALLPSALALFVTERRGARRAVYGVLFLTMTGALLATLTRSSWLGAAAGLAALAAFPRMRARLAEVPRPAGLLLGLSLAMALAWPSSTISAGYTPTFVGRLTEYSEIAKRDGFYSPLHQRLLIWSCAWQMGAESPVLGKGAGLFELFYPFYQGNLLHEDPFWRNMRTHANNAHNEVVETFAQTGIAGVGAFLWLWTVFFACAWRWRRGKAGEDPAWAGAVAGALAVLVDNLLNVSLHFAVPAFLFWWLVGAAMGRSARDGAPVLEWRAPAAVRRAAATAIVLAALFVSWLQVRAWFREAWYFAGFKLARQGALPSATRALERSRDWGPPEVNALYELGNAYIRSGRPEPAESAYRQALAANAGYDEIYFNLATVLANHLRRPDEAGPYYQTAWAINPLSSDAANGLTAFLLRDPAANGARALRALEEAARQFPQSPNHWNNIGYLRVLEKRWPEAETAYERAILAAPDHGLAERNLEAVAVQSGRPRRPILAAMAELRSLEASASKGNWAASSVARAAALAARYPELARARFLHGSLLLANGRPAEAVPELEAACAREPGRAAPSVNLARAYLALGRRDEAVARVRAAMALEPGNPAIRDFWAALQAGPPPR